MAEFKQLVEAVSSCLIHDLNYRKNGTWVSGKSPFREDTHPSFSYNMETGWGYDHATHESYSTRDLCKRLGVSIDDNRITHYEPPKVKLTTPSEKDYGSVQIDFRFIEHCYHTGQTQAMAYFGQYGIDEQTCAEHMLGYCKWNSQRRAGVMAGWTIPYFYTMPNQCKVVAGIRIRRDDVSTTGDMPKYYGVPSSLLSMPYTDEVICSPDQKRIARGLDALFIVEDEKSSLVLKTLLRGLPMSAIAFRPEERWNVILPKVVSNALKVIIIQDNDDLKDNGDQGRTNALKLQQILMPTSSSIIKPPVNDIADLVKELGKQKAFDWLKSQPACKNLF